MTTTPQPPSLLLDDQLQPHHMSATAQQTGSSHPTPLQKHQLTTRCPGLPPLSVAMFCSLSTTSSPSSTRPNTTAQQQSSSSSTSAQADVTRGVLERQAQHVSGCARQLETPLRCCDCGAATSSTPSAGGVPALTVTAPPALNPHHPASPEPSPHRPALNPHRHASPEPSPSRAALNPGTAPPSPKP